MKSDPCCEQVADASRLFILCSIVCAHILLCACVAHMHVHCNTWLLVVLKARKEQWGMIWG
jgi:hypothetical protein